METEKELLGLLDELVGGKAEIAKQLLTTLQRGAPFAVGSMGTKVNSNGNAAVSKALSFQPGDEYAVLTAPTPPPKKKQKRGNQDFRT